MSGKLKKIIALLLIAMMLVTFCACGNKGDEGNDKDTTNNVVNNENVGNAPTEDEKENNLGLKENEGISEEGIVFDKTLTLNGYSFLLGCDLDEFLDGAGAVIAAPEILEDFKNDKRRNTKGLNCYIPYGDSKVEFYITVTHGDNGNIELCGIEIFRTIEYIEDGTAEELEVIPCGFEFLGGYNIDKNQFHDLPEEILAVSKHYKDSVNDGYEVILKAAYGEQWSIVVSSTNRKSSDSSFYAIYSVAAHLMP